MSNTYGDRLHEALLLTNRDRRELADALAVSVQAIAQVISGKSKALTAENSERAARFLQIDAFWLATGEGLPRPISGPSPTLWPFSRVSQEQWADLNDLQRGRIEGFAQSVLGEIRETTLSKDTPPD